MMIATRLLCFVLGALLLWGAAACEEAKQRELPHFSSASPAYQRATADTNRMRDELLTALLVGYAVQQRCMVVPPLTRSLEISQWLVTKYTGVTSLTREMRDDLESTAQAYCDNNG